MSLPRLESYPPKTLESQKDFRFQTSVRTTEEMVRLIETVIRAMAEAGYSKKDQFAIRLALEEAIVNGIKHGNQNDRTKRVRVRYQVKAGWVLAEVEDQGKGFDPNQVPDPLDLENLDQPSGRGLLLMRSYTTWIRHNPRGNQVTLGKYRSPTNDH